MVVVRLMEREEERRETSPETVIDGRVQGTVGQ